MLNKLKGIGILLVCIGLSIVVGFRVKLYTDGVKQDQIKEQFLALCEAYREQQNWNEESPMVATGEIVEYEALPGETIAIIEMPDIDLNVSVVEGIEKDDIKLNVGHFPQTDMPWVEGGNFAVAGHSSIVYNCLFNDLHKAKEGMICTVTTQYGIYNYKVISTRVVEAKDVSILERSENGDTIMTMTTCINGGTQRLIVIAERDI